MDIEVDVKMLVDSALLGRSEVTRLDFKETLPEDLERFTEHINAFSNTPGGGYFVFGIARDFSSRETSVENESIVKTTFNIATSRMEPAISCRSLFVETKYGPKLAIFVPESLQKPVFIKDRAPWGGSSCFRRVLSSTLPLSVEEIRELMAFSRVIYRDNEPLEQVKVSDLDLDKIRLAFPEIGSDSSAHGSIGALKDRGILTAGGAVTKAGFLVFGRDVSQVRQLRNASIEFQIFRNTTREDPIKKASIVGALPDQIEAAKNLLIQHLWVRPKIEGMKRTETPIYDLDIIREIVVNSLVHRDYGKMHQPVKIALFANRLEVENPGGLMPGLNELNIVHRRKWRNPNLAELMKSAGFGDMDGQGIDRLLSISRRYSLPAPKFRNFGASFSVTLSGPKEFDEFTSEEKRDSVISVAVSEKVVDNETLRNVFGIDMSRASTLLTQLVGDGTLCQIGPGGRWSKYVLSVELNRRLNDES